MLKGNIYTTDDIQFIRPIPNPRILIVSGSLQSERSNEISTVLSMNGILAQQLFPPINALAKLISGNIQEFYSEYFSYLKMDRNANAIINLILAALYRGENIIIYRTMEDSETGFIRGLLLYFLSAFGIKIGTSAEPRCRFDMAFSNIVLERIYLSPDFNKADFIRFVNPYIPMSDKLIINYLEHERPFPRNESNIVNKGAELIKYLKKEYEETGKVKRLAIKMID